MFPTITVLLETTAFEAVRQADVDGVDSEADALESVTLKVMFWLVGLQNRLDRDLPIKSLGIFVVIGDTSPPCGWPQSWPLWEARAIWSLRFGL